MPSHELESAHMTKKRKCDHKDNPIGTINTNYILDTHIYELELPYIRVEEYSVKYILENLYEQMDENIWYMGVLQ